MLVMASGTIISALPDVEPNSSQTRSIISPENILRRKRMFPQAPFTPARCTLKSVRKAPNHVRSAGWRLEPETFSLNTGPDPEYIDMRRRFWVSAASLTTEAALYGQVYRPRSALP